MRSTRLLRSVAGMVLATAMTALGQPVITESPQNQTNLLGTTATFTVQATGTEPLAYQWQQAYDLHNYVDRPEGTNRSLVIASVGDLDKGNYRVIVSDVQGAVTSSVARLYVVSPNDPEFTRHPTNQSVSLGGSASFSVRLTTSWPPVRWHWQFRRSLQEEPMNLPGHGGSTPMIDLTVTNITAEQVGFYSVVATNSMGMVTHSQDSELILDPTFVKVTSGAIVTDTASFFPGSWGDYNGDGFSDVFSPAGVDVLSQTPGFYRNEGGTNFTRMAQADVGRFVASIGYFAQGLWGDFNNDDRLDMLQSGGDSTYGRYRFFLGSGEGGFQEVTTDNGVNRLNKWSVHNSTLDYDSDGLLDIFLTTGSEENYPSALFRNNGDGSFTKAWETPRFSFSTQSSQWGDYDNDGDMDLWATGVIFGTDPLLRRGRFFRNEGNGRFVELTSKLPAVTGFFGAWADVNNDGYLDYIDDAVVMRNNQDGTMTSLPLSTKGDTLKVCGDYDNDGDLDLFYGRWKAALVVLRNDGDFNFTPVQVGSPTLDQPAQESIPTVCDYDNDGFLDVFVATRGNPGGVNFLYHNTGREGGNTNHWLIVKPKGTTSNRCAVGAKVRVLARVFGKETWQLRQITGSYYDDFRAHFGLGDAARIDTVRIEWPSGTVQEFKDVAVDQLLTVTEPRRPVLAITPSATQVDGRLTADPNLPYEVRVSGNMSEWTVLTTVTTDAEGKGSWTDPGAGGSAARFYRAVRQ